MKLIFALFVSLAMALTGTLSASAHTQLHLSELSSPSAAQDGQVRDPATALHTAFYTHDDPHHHHHHDDGDEEDDHNPEDHANHSHSSAVAASVTWIDTTHWGAVVAAFDHDDRVSDPLYLAEHIPD